LKVFYGIQSIKKIKKMTAIGMGVFDGLHLGHRKVLRNLSDYAKKMSYKSLVITFEPHPEKIWNKEPIYYINSLQQRLELIAKMNIDYCLVINFSHSFALLEAEDFILKVLKEKLNLGAMVVSEDYRFGYKAKGTSKLLDKLSRKYDFKLKVIKPLKISGEIINSTSIRKLLAQKKLNQAKKLLRREYFIEGNVIKGSQVGRKIGFPTVNISESENVLIPEGVYTVMVQAKNKQYHAVANIGYKPTVSHELRKRHIELHLLNYKGYFRAKRVRVHFIKWLRNERHFKNIPDLQRAIAADVKKAKNLLNI